MSLIARFALTLAASVCCVSAGVSAQTDDRNAKPANGSVSGRVMVGEKPVRRVAVALLPRNSYNFPLPADTPRARTDEGGRYRVTGVAAGGYRVVAFALHLVMDDTGDNGWPGKIVTVDGNEEVENVNLTLRPGGVITGRVTDAGGKPVRMTACGSSSTSTSRRGRQMTAASTASSASRRAATGSPSRRRRAACGGAPTTPARARPSRPRS
jgi:hypothetical protein